MFTTVVVLGQVFMLTNASAIPWQRRRVFADTVERIEGENGFDCASGVMTETTALTEGDSYKRFTGGRYCNSAVYGIVVAGMDFAAEQDGSVLESVKCATIMTSYCSSDAIIDVLAIVGSPASDATKAYSSSVVPAINFVLFMGDFRSLRDTIYSPCLTFALTKPPGGSHSVHSSGSHIALALITSGENKIECKDYRREEDLRRI